MNEPGGEPAAATRNTVTSNAIKRARTIVSTRHGSWIGLCVFALIAVACTSGAESSTASDREPVAVSTLIGYADEETRSVGYVDFGEVALGLGIDLENPTEAEQRLFDSYACTVRPTCKTMSRHRSPRSSTPPR